MALSLFGGPRDLFSMPDPFGPLLAPPDVWAGPPAVSRIIPRATLVDVKETDNEFIVSADIPGVKREDIKVSVDNDVLNLKVDSKSEKEEDREEQGTKWHRTERHSVFMQRSLRMPENANMDEIKAKYENGVLSLTVPKREIDGGKAKKLIEIE